jgi:hypothetical protein
MCGALATGATLSKCGAGDSGATRAATSDRGHQLSVDGPRRMGVWRQGQGRHMGMCGAREGGATQKG